MRSVPASTGRVYRGDWLRYLAWCKETGAVPRPAAVRTLADYCNELANAGKAPSTIERALSAISKAHTSDGFERPDLSEARAVLVTYKRESGRRKRKAEPLTITALRAMVAALDSATPAGVRDRALIVLGFALGARRSEIAALNLDDLTETDAGLTVLIRTSKTDRESKGREVAIPYGTQPETCPVRSVRAWIALLAVNGRTAGPLFLRIDKHGKIGRDPSGRGTPDGRLGDQAVARIINRHARRAGLKADAVWSGHSLRRGFATATYEAGADPLRIARHGGWKDGSATLLGYIEEVDRWKANPLAGVGL